MTTVRMSIHHALSELKLLNSRIEKAKLLNFVIANKVSNKIVNGQNLDDVRKTLEGNFDSIAALIENRKKIKAAVVLSNATTDVTIAGKVYKVAEAIEYKSSVALERQFLEVLRRQFNQHNLAVETSNAQLSGKLETYLTSVLGDKGSRDPETVKMHTKVFEDQNRFELIDPKHIAKYIAELETSIDSFEAQVDYILSESNASTFVEVDLA